MSDRESAFSNRLKAAAAALTGTIGSREAVDLLRYLGYDDADARAAPGRIRMLHAGATFRRLFRLPMPDAPGLTFFGAEADPAIFGPHNKGLPIGGFAGSGLDARRAFESCVGEGVEYLSQFAHPDDPLESGTIDAFGPLPDPLSYGFVQAVALTCGVPADHAISWIPVQRLTDGATCRFPADLCLRRACPDLVPPLKLSTGCAAGVTRQAATLHAILELIERDAAALWWRGGRRGRPVAADTETGIATLLSQVRLTQNDRRTSLLDITTDLGIPVVVAFSSRQDEGGFALGLAARTTQAEAARSAIFEMCQSELSLHVIATKQRESGDAALNASDRRQLARAAILDPGSCVLLQPEDLPVVASAELCGDPVEAIIRLLAAQGIVAYSLDLTRPRFAIPVIRVIAPGLQSDPCEIITDRLAWAIQETGGGTKYSKDITLL